MTGTLTAPFTTGSSGRLTWPGEAMETDVSFVLFSGLDAVATVEEQESGYAVR